MTNTKYDLVLPDIPYNRDKVIIEYVFVNHTGYEVCSKTRIVDEVPATVECMLPTCKLIKRSTVKWTLFSSGLSDLFSKKCLYNYPFFNYIPVIINIERIFVYWTWLFVRFSTSWTKHIFGRHGLVALHLFIVSAFMNFTVIQDYQLSNLIKVIIVQRLVSRPVDTWWKETVW